MSLAMLVNTALDKFLTEYRRSRDALTLYLASLETTTWLEQTEEKWGPLLSLHKSLEKHPSFSK